MKKGTQKENTLEFIYAQSIYYNINIFLNYYFLANSVTILFEVFLGCYSIAHTVWSVS